MRRRAARVARSLVRIGLWSGPILLLAFILWQTAYYHLDRAYPPALARYESRARLVLDETGAVLRAFTTKDGLWRFHVSPEEVSPLYLAMLKAYEDKRYDEHAGVDFLAVGRATGQMVAAGEVVSGASTLTMQAARLLEPRPRTLESKLVEMFRALQLERRFDKREVLSIYLTLAPFGGNLEGVRAASLAYFGKEPRRLTPAEAALLVALPQAPSLLRPEVAPEAARRARDKVLERVAAAGVITAKELAEAKEAPVPTRRLAMPFLAPHLAERLVAAAPAAETITTTIDARLQAQAEFLTSRAARQLGEGVTAAVVVVETATGKVKAQVGSAGYFDFTRAGMIDMTGALRSPGSALKPFIYGLAFERLVAHPDTLVADKPRRFGVYAPTNFDQAFNGEVTLAEALQRSLNVPAVLLLERVGPARFDRRLSDVGVTLAFRRDGREPGLALALGGAGIRLTDLVKLYTGVARGGTPVELQWLADETPRETETPLMSEVAAWYLTTILERTPRPLGYRLAEAAGGRNHIAFKTGTSYGYRDALAIGFSGRHTIGVWLGRADGGPCAGCIGIIAAAPLLFQVADLLPPEPAPSSFRTPPAGVIAGPTNKLPPALKRLSFKRSLELPGEGPPPAIAFPLDGTTLNLARRGSELEALPLKVEGGKRPYTWLVNGRPLATGAWRGPVIWQPDGEGFVELQVIDAIGRSASVNIFVDAD